MKKRIISLLLAFVLLLGMMSAAAGAEMSLPEKELSVADGVIDLTDKTIFTYFSNRYYTTITDLAVSGADVSAAYEDGTTVYVLLSYRAADDAAVTATFGYSQNGCTVSGATAGTTLENGEGTLTMTVEGKYSNSKKGSATYNLFFIREEAPTQPPVCLKDTDAAEIWLGQSLELNLKEYFSAAETYYLVDGGGITAIDREYTFTPEFGGEYTLVFAAANEVGMSEGRLTVTVNVKTVSGGVYVGHTTTNGSMDSVVFADADGNPIEGITATYADKQITVILPKTYDLSGQVKAVFGLTQNASGYPFLSTKTATAGTSSNKAVNNKFTEKTTVLSAGTGSLTFYYFNSAPNGSNQETFKLVYKIANDLPVLADGVAATAEATITAGENYTVDLGDIFSDPDDTELTYKVSVDGAAAVAVDANYSYTTDVAGTYVLVFTASDGKDPSAETYTVTLTVENSARTNTMTVLVPESADPSFYASTGFGEDGLDLPGAEMAAVSGEAADGLTAYTVTYPVNVEALSVRTAAWGGMAFATVENGTVTLRQVQMAVVDYDNNPAESICSVTYDGHTAVSGTEGWLLAAGKEYTFTATPRSGDLTTESKTETLEAGTGVYTASMRLGIKDPLTLTVPTGAKAQMYQYDTGKYYFATELDAKIVTDNGDGTTTYCFIGDTKNGTFIYHVSMEGKAAKSGWIAWGKQNISVTFGEGDKTADYRLDDYSATGTANSTMTEDSVLLNVNSRNHLVLPVGGTRVLKAYRAWEIIPVSYQNYILTPDFTYTILSGSDVVSLTEKRSPSTADGDWMTLTALQEGVAVIEVTYDAMEVTGGQYDGVYGASDPARTGLVVVQVGGTDDTSVKFGIDCFSSFGSTTYAPANAAEWDAEFDTLYFIGNRGKMTLRPTAAGEILEVAVSHDKGMTWNVLAGESGAYTAEIVSGNNILRVTTEAGTAYQVVRGDKVTVTFAEVSQKSDGDGVVEAGETIRVTLKGLHMPVPKMAGNYNPGATDSYAGNGEKVRLKYTVGGETVTGIDRQYDWITNGNYVDVTIPADTTETSVTLKDGYIGFGVIGLTGFTKGGDSHRNIPDAGCSTRGNQATLHTRSILPEITVSVGDTSAPNTAPVVRGDAPTEGSIYLGQNYAINPDTLFVDPDGDPLTFMVSVDGAEAEEASVDYQFTPSELGEYVLTFTASDGRLTAEHTVAVAVTARPQVTPPKDTFGLEQGEIAGYVTMSFEDNGIRVPGETGLDYPVPLGTIIPATQVPYRQGENIAQVTQRLLERLGIGMRYTGSLTGNFYLGAITDFEVSNTPYASMGEFDAGVGSGWMITQNDTFIGKGASEFLVENGDVIRWQYTCQYGADIGDHGWQDQSKPAPKPEDQNKEETKTGFCDVSESDYYFEAVKWAAELGITHGTTESTFSPEEVCTRAQMVTFLWRAAGCPEPSGTETAFGDVDKDAYYYKALLWAVEQGITSGTTQSTFSPDAVCSRSQMVTFLYRNANSPAVRGSHAFSDVQSGAYYHDAVIWAAEQGVTKGTSDTAFSPCADCTRGQMVTFLYRYLGKE